MSSNRNCWDCGAPIPDGADHCPDCGLPAIRPEDAAPVNVAAAPATPPPPPKPAPEPKPRPEPKPSPAAGAQPQLSRGVRNTIVGVSIVVLMVVLFLLYLKKQPPAQGDGAMQADNGRVTADQQSDAPGGMPPGMPPGAAGSAPPLPADQAKQLEMLKQAVDKSPANFTHVVGLANTFYDAQRYAEAIPYYRKGLALVGTQAARDIPETAALDTRVDLATCLFHNGNHDEAIKEIDSVLAKDPHHGNALYNKGVIAKMAGRTDEAMQSWKLYIQYHPDAPRAADIRKELGMAGGAPSAAPSGKKYP